MRGSRYIHQVFCFTFIFYSCTTTTPPSRPSNSPEPVRESLTGSSETGWLPKQVPGDEHYFLIDTVVISTSTDSSHTRSSETKIFYSFKLTHVDDSLVFAARADSFIINTGISSQKTVTDTELTREFHGVLSAIGQISSLSKSSYCTTGVAPIAVRVFELTLSYPRKTLKVGDEWIDTVSTTICRGKIVVLQQSIRQYRLIGFSSWNRYSVARILRNVSSTFSTNVQNPRNTLIATGFGKSQAIIVVDQESGVLLESSANSESTFLITTSRGVFAFTQNISTHIELH